MLTLALACTTLALAAPQSDRAAAEAFAGRWMTRFGPLELRVKGKKLAGKYGWDSEGHLEGEVSRKGLEFEWSSPGGRGEGRVELWKDGRTFTGTLERHGGGEEGWGGYRLERKRAEPVPGEIADGQTELGLEYHLRVPKGFDPAQRYTAVALFHGSNARSRDYVEGFPGNWPEIAERFVVVGFDGEQLSPFCKDPQRTFNSSYVNFSGDRVGEPWRYMQTPALVAGALRELSAELPIERWYVGGHSQGGFLTFAVAMYYPELVAGAFPTAGNLLVQCEPEVFDDEAVRAAQRRIPIAIVHGEKDAVVPFSAATYCLDQFQDGGFPMLRLFTNRGGHPWAFLPVDEALLWLDQMNGDDPERLVAFARESLDAGHHRDACAALARARELGLDGDLAAAADAVEAEVDADAAKPLARLEKLMKDEDDDGWVDAFWEFRGQYGLAPSAQGVLERYAKLRKKQEDRASKLWWRIRDESDRKKAEELCRELVERYPASSAYRLAKSRL